MINQFNFKKPFLKENTINAVREVTSFAKGGN